MEFGLVRIPRVFFWMTKKNTMMDTSQADEHPELYDDSNRQSFRAKVECLSCAHLHCAEWVLLRRFIAACVYTETG